MRFPGSGRLGRIEAADLLDGFSKNGGSIREFSRRSGVPRTTLQHWFDRVERIDMPESAVRFFESGDGQRFLHRLYVALLLELHERGNCSLRALSCFLRGAGLDRFIPSSKTSLAKGCAELESAVVDFAAREHDRMAADMPAKQITVAEDETFPSGICLVAIESVSNFILLEKMADNRNLG